MRQEVRRFSRLCGQMFYCLGDVGSCLRSVSQSEAAEQCCVSSGLALCGRS